MSKILSEFLLFYIIFFCSCQSPNKKRDQLIESATKFFNQENYQQVIKMLQSESHQNPLEPRLVVLLAHAHYKESLWEKAALHYETLTKIDPQNNDFIRLCAMSWENSNEPTKAIHFYQLYLEKKPNRLDTWEQLGNLQTNEKNYSGALESFLKVSQFPTREKDGNLCNRIAALNKILERPNKAQFWYQKGLQSKGSASLEAILNLIEIALRQKEEQTLIRLLDNLDRDFPVLRKEHVVLEAQNWIQEQISKPLTETIDLANPENHQIEEVDTALRGSVPVVMEEKSVSATTQAKSFDSPSGKPFTNISDDFILVTEAIELNPTLPDEAVLPVDDFEGAEVQEPTFSILGARALEQGNHFEAIQQYWKSLNQNPKNGDDWFSLGKAYRIGNDLQKAEIALLQAMQINASSIPYLLEYLAVIAQTRSSNRAIRQMIQAYDRFPQEPDIVLMLAKAYQDLADNSREANLYYQKFLELAPQHPEADEIQELLENN